jgi:hypothetical protein
MAKRNRSRQGGFPYAMALSPDNSSWHESRLSATRDDAQRFNDFLCQDYRQEGETTNEV